MERIQAAASCLRLERQLGHPMCTSASDAADHAHACMQLFVQWAPAMAACDERETLVGEQAAEHAVVACMAAFRLSGKMSYLVQVRGYVPELFPPFKRTRALSHTHSCTWRAQNPVSQR